MSGEKAPQPVVPVSASYQTGQPIQTVILQPNTVLNQAIILHKDPSHIICPNCKASVVTKVNYKSGCGTWLICLGLCLFGFDLGCQFIPFCVKACKDAHHTCPNCNSFVGKKVLI